MKTPYYLFSAEDFRKRISLIKKGLPGVKLTFSIKANPFLLYTLKDDESLSHVEVCSPGELSICKHCGIEGKKIIYSGVMKESEDIYEAVSYGARYVTAESPLHFRLICEEAKKSGKRVRVLLRLTSGNQFGMSEDDIIKILSIRDKENADIAGFHFYSGTAKNKLKQIEKDAEKLSFLSERAYKETDFSPELIEYGPGLSAEYYEEPYDEKDEALLKELAPKILSVGENTVLGIEMGRFMAAPAGKYFTTVKDIKENNGTTYVIVDGGVHQLKYYGQNMAMKVPPVSVYRDGEKITAQENAEKSYSVCGSLCTVADVLVRKTELPELKPGDVLCFERCGAYSVTEGALSFLSRDLPEIWIEDKERRCLRSGRDSWSLNCDLS